MKAGIIQTNHYLRQRAYVWHYVFDLLAIITKNQIISLKDFTFIPHSCVLNLEL